MFKWLIIVVNNIIMILLSVHWGACRVRAVLSGQHNGADEKTTDSTATQDKIIQPPLDSKWRNQTVSAHSMAWCHFNGYGQQRQKCQQHTTGHRLKAVVNSHKRTTRTESFTITRKFTTYFNIRQIYSFLFFNNFSSFFPISFHRPRNQKNIQCRQVTAANARRAVTWITVGNAIRWAVAKWFASPTGGGNTISVAGGDPICAGPRWRGSPSATRHGSWHPPMNQPPSLCSVAWFIGGYP